MVTATSTLATATVNVQCPVATPRALGGGATISGTASRTLRRSAPINAANALVTSGAATGWSVQFANSVAGDVTTAYVICGP